MYQAGPSRAGATPDPIPSTNDTAWKRALPGVASDLVLVHDLLLVGTYALDRVCSQESCDDFAGERGFDGIVALDAASGEERWRLPVEEGVYSLAYDRGTLVIQTLVQTVQAFEYRTRELLWSSEALPRKTGFDFCYCSPPLLVSDGLVLAGGGEVKASPAGDDYFTQ